MSKNFRREQFGNSGFAKFPDYAKALPPPSGKNEENKKPINIFFALVLFMLISNIIYTLGTGALFSILNSSGLVSVNPGLWDIFLFVTVFQFMRTWDRFSRPNSKKP